MTYPREPSALRWRGNTAPRARCGRSRHHTFLARRAVCRRRSISAITSPSPFSLCSRLSMSEKSARDPPIIPTRFICYFQIAVLKSQPHGETGDFKLFPGAYQGRGQCLSWEARVLSLDRVFAADEAMTQIKEIKSFLDPAFICVICGQFFTAFDIRSVFNAISKYRTDRYLERQKRHYLST